MGRGLAEPETLMSTVPHIVRKSLLSGADQVAGVAVVIDVYRAFTSAAFMIHLGATHIVLETDPDAVLRLRDETGCLAVGEVGGRPVPGFDLGNSPADILAAGPRTFRGRMVAQRTSAGVSGAVAAAHRADSVVLGSYVTAGAISRYILDTLSPGNVVTLVAMGNAGREITPEDEACADYIESLVSGRPYDHAAALHRILGHECTRKFLRGDQEHFPPADPVLCLQRDLFSFVLLASWEDGRLVARPVAVPRDAQL